MVTPLPAANPSDLTTIGVLNSDKTFLASVSDFTSKYFAVGILNFLQKFFIKILEPSNWEAFIEGPKTLIPLPSK